MKVNAGLQYSNQEKKSAYIISEGKKWQKIPITSIKFYFVKIYCKNFSLYFQAFGLYKVK